MPSPSSVLRYYIDSPVRWSDLSPHVIVRGWAFVPGGPAIRRLRLRTTEQIHFGAVGLPRPDVYASLPEAGGPNCGFEVRATLVPGEQDLALEAETTDGTWHRLSQERVTVRRPRRPAWLGGGTPGELVAFQMPAHARHGPRPITLDRYPRYSAGLRPRIAIVTPSYNQAPFLGETMDSVLGAGAAAVDYVVQDGASTDDSPALIRARSPRLHAWASAPDDGQADAIAKGFARTAGQPGDLMAWINSDDFYLPGALPFVAAYFARHPEVDAIYGHRILVDGQSREVGRWFLPRHSDEILRLNDFVPQETLFWRRRLWDRVGGLDTTFRFAMDWDLLLRFAAAGARIVRVPYFLACFRLHPAQKTSAAMHHYGQAEIDQLRRRAQGREIPPQELEGDPRLIRYLRQSSFIEWLWSLGLRAP
jgi:hypothetical protein